MIFNYSFTYKHNPVSEGSRPVAVVANFAVDGRFIPVYFRYIADDSSECTYKIHGIKYIRDKQDCFLFCCLFENEGIEQQVFLTFKYKECLWLLGT